MTRRLRIVVADDEEDVREYFQRILPHLGHDVAGVACNGRELLEICRQQRPDMIISDLRMPEMDGDEALRAFCSERPTPCILVTAFSKSVEEPAESGGLKWMFLTKPIKRRDLETAIASVSDEES